MKQLAASSRHDYNISRAARTETPSQVRNAASFQVHRESRPRSPANPAKSLSGTQSAIVPPPVVCANPLATLAAWPGSCLRAKKNARKRRAGVLPKPTNAGSTAQNNGWRRIRSTTTRQACQTTAADSALHHLRCQWQGVQPGHRGCLRTAHSHPASNASAVVPHSIIGACISSRLAGST